MAVAIELQDVSVAFRAPNGIVSVLHQLSLNISIHSWTAIVGPNGSGKSTLGRVMAGLCETSNGKVVRHAGRVQMVFQNPDAQLVGQTVYEDVSFGLENLPVHPNDIPGRVMEALSQVGLQHLVHAEVNRLSGGQKQLLCIASALCLHPSVLVFDESTAMLDPLSRSRVLDVVRQLHQSGTTIIWITQWMEELAEAQRVLALDAGRIVFDGTPGTFFYGEESASGVFSSDTMPSPCETLGFPLPYAVQLARALRRNDIILKGNPVSVPGVANAVTSR